MSTTSSKDAVDAAAVTPREESLWKSSLPNVDTDGVPLSQVTPSEIVKPQMYDAPGKSPEMLERVPELAAQNASTGPESAASGDGAGAVLPGGVMAVTDPLSRKLLVPVGCIRPTQATSRPGVPSLCLLFLDGRCRQGGQCHQVHADPAVVLQLRAEAKQVPTCCVAHGDIHGARLREEWLDRLVEIQTEPPVIVPLRSMAFTLALERLMADSGRTAVVRAPLSQICRLHATERCRFTEDCRFLHICRSIMRERFSGIVPDLVPQLELRHRAGGLPAVSLRPNQFAPPPHQTQGMPQIVVLPDGRVAQVLDMVPTHVQGYSVVPQQHQFQPPQHHSSHQHQHQPASWAQPVMTSPVPMVQPPPHYSSAQSPPLQQHFDGMQQQQPHMPQHAMVPINHPNVVPQHLHHQQHPSSPQPHFPYLANPSAQLGQLPAPSQYSQGHHVPPPPQQQQPQQQQPPTSVYRQPSYFGY